MNQILAYSFLICAVTITTIPIIGYIKSKYYHIDTTPIHYWLNKKQKIKKRYKTFRKHRLSKRNKNTKISNLNKRNISELSYAKYGKLNRHNIGK